MAVLSRAEEITFPFSRQISAWILLSKCHVKTTTKHRHHIINIVVNRIFKKNTIKYVQNKFYLVRAKESFCRRAQRRNYNDHFHVSHMSTEMPTLFRNSSPLMTSKSALMLIAHGTPVAARAEWSNSTSSQHRNMSTHIIISSHLTESKHTSTATEASSTNGSEWTCCDNDMVCSKLQTDAALVYSSSSTSTAEWGNYSCSSDSSGMIDELGNATCNCVQHQR